MTNKELQALRKLLMLDVSEAAEYIGKLKSPRAWQYWEAGRSPVPDDVVNSMLDLGDKRLTMIDELEKQIKKSPNNQPVYYLHFEDFQEKQPKGTVIDWRLGQSVAAYFYGEGISDLA